MTVQKMLKMLKGAETKPSAPKTPVTTRKTTLKMRVAEMLKHFSTHKASEVIPAIPSAFQHFRLCRARSP